MIQNYWHPEPSLRHRRQIGEKKQEMAQRWGEEISHHQTVLSGHVDNSILCLQ